MLKELKYKWTNNKSLLVCGGLDRVMDGVIDKVMDSRQR